MSDRTAALAAAVRELMPRAKTELAELVSFRSVADFRQFPPEESAKAADWVADALRGEGFPDVRLLDTPDGTQSVYGYLPGPAGAPTVLLYAHYDVQPPLDEAAWTTPPFELTDGPDGRWYGRGSADCKGGILMHLTALRTLRGQYGDGPLPVGIKFIAEGSEETGTGGLEEYVKANPGLLTADAVLVGDTGNFATGLPTATTTLRGMAMAEITVTGLAGNLHSGQFGGAAPDALAGLIRILDGLRDAEGSTTVDGLPNNQVWDGVQYSEEAFRADAKTVEGTRLIGTGTVSDRVWARPAVTVLGIDCPPVIGATPSVQASAKALVSLRVPPGMDAAGAQQALVDHLSKPAPWGLRVEVEPGGSGEAFRARTDGPAYRALGEAMFESYGTEMVAAGMGGSIPLTNVLQQTYPDAEIVLIGMSDPAAQIHALDESVSPEELQRMSLGVALFLEKFGAAAGNAAA
jgi:acetylornithine deacetylase/succinyl-diaminopimelate desuccinylase-like protein